MGIEQWIVLIIVIWVIYLVSKRFTKKEATKFYQEHNEPLPQEDTSTLDPNSEVLVTFLFKAKKDQFMINSFPNIQIDGIGTFKLVNDEKTLKLPPVFIARFGVPYMTGQAFKITQKFQLQLGKKYLITFKPKVFVYQKPKVTIEEIY